MGSDRSTVRPMGADPRGQQPIEVFWRVGCTASRDLRGMLSDHEVGAAWRNVGNDRGALDFVRRHGDASGGTPLVRVGAMVLTDPSWRELAPLIGRDPDEPVRPPEPRPYASAGSCTPTAYPNTRGEREAARRPLPVALTVLLLAVIGAGVVLVGQRLLPVVL